MRKLGLVFALSALCAVSAPPVSTAQDQSTQVVGGSADRQPDVQWIAALTYRGRYECVGSLVSQRYVLTAAHCVEGTFVDPRVWRVRLGSKHRTFGGSLVRVAGGEIYPRYRPRTLYGDMAVMRLERPVRYTPVQLVPSGTHYVGAPGYVAGWGSTSSSGPPPGDLRSAFIPIRADSACTRRWYGEPYYGR